MFCHISLFCFGFSYNSHNITLFHSTWFALNVEVLWSTWSKTIVGKDQLLTSELNGPNITWLNLKCNHIQEPISSKINGLPHGLPHSQERIIKLIFLFCLVECSFVVIILFYSLETNNNINKLATIRTRSNLNDHTKFSFLKNFGSSFLVDEFFWH